MLSRNVRTALMCAAGVAGMIGMSYAAVPLYDAFCRVTGFGGTTQRAEKEADTVLERAVTVRFDANTARGMSWSFAPQQVSQTLKVGETGLAFYKASNPTGRPIMGTATFNVSPAKAGVYFKKIECFCFQEQILNPGESMDMPVTYYVDPSIAENPYLDDVATITLSYTFFEVEDGEMKLASR
ncbi:MAG: cytochrome c oxidase assembly protein [Pseudomonadota bacterium]